MFISRVTVCLFVCLFDPHHLVFRFVTDVTPHAEYAALYSLANKEGVHAVILCLAVAGNTYPVSRKTDYPHPDNFSAGSVSCFHYQVN